MSQLLTERYDDRTRKTLRDRVREPRGIAGG